MKSSRLNFCHWNLNGIAAHDFVKVLLIEAFIKAKNIDIICLPETFLDSTIPLKVGLSPSKKICVLLDWKSFENDEKCFLFHLKSSFLSQDFFLILFSLWFFVATFWSYIKIFQKRVSTTFCVWFFKKNVSHVTFYQLTKIFCPVAFTSWDIGQYVYYNCLLTRLWHHKFEVNLSF